MDSPLPLSDIKAMVAFSYDPRRLAPLSHDTGVKALETLLWVAERADLATSEDFDGPLTIKADMELRDWLEGK